MMKTYQYCTEIQADLSWTHLYHSYMPHEMLAFIKRPLIKNKIYRLFYKVVGSPYAQSDSGKVLVFLLYKQTNKKSQGNREIEPANAVLDLYMGRDYQIESKEFFYWEILKPVRLLLG